VIEIEGVAMAEHPNVVRIRDGYAAFSKGDVARLNDFFAEDIVWHVGGRGQVAGDYRGREAVYGYFGKLNELTARSFHIDVHAILADDEYGVAVLVGNASRDGRSIKTNDVHVFHLHGGKVVEFWDASTDQYSGDELFA
jgi:hypothetical protein